MPRNNDAKQDANLDVLRSIAVLLVLAFHLTNNHILAHPVSFLWGRFGVLIFFVHTSLVLMMSLDRLATQHARIAWPFYIQRAFRIYPLSITCVLAIVLFHIPPEVPFDSVTPVPYSPPSRYKLISNLLLVQNIRGHRSITGPLWSLPFEVQMYLVLPFLHWLLKRNSSWQVMASMIVISIGLGSICLVSDHGHLFEFFPCFMGGILAYWLRSKQKADLPPLLFPVWVVILGLINATVPFRGISFVVCLLLGASLGYFRDVRPGLAAASAHQIAKYSYGIYLFHLPLVAVCFQMWPVISPLLSWILYSASLALVVIVLYHGLEAPLIRLGKKLTTPARVSFVTASVKIP